MPILMPYRCTDTSITLKMNVIIVSLSGRTNFYFLHMKVPSPVCANSLDLDLLLPARETRWPRLVQTSLTHLS